MTLKVRHLVIDADFDADLDADSDSDSDAACLEPALKGGKGNVI